MSKEALVEESKKLWNSGGQSPSTNELALGCLQRIATALESLNRSWCSVQEQNVRFRETIRTLEKSNARLRGEVARVKKRSLTKDAA